MKRLKQKQLTAYNRKTTHDIFFMTIEWLEKYIEVAGYYSDWNDRKQVRNNNIKRLDIIGNPEKAERDFSTQLLLLEPMLRRNPLFRDEIKAEFYKWISAVEIDANNIPMQAERLKHVLFEFNEVLDGRGEKLRKDIENREDELDPNSPEYMKQMSEVFIHMQTPMQNEKEIEKSMIGKNWNEIDIKSNFNKGSSEKGKKAFDQISKEVAGKNDKFFFFPQKDQEKMDTGDDFPNENPQQVRRNLIENIKQNIKDWNINEVITYYREKKYLDEALINKLVEAKLDETGYPLFNQETMYLKDKFNKEEWSEIRWVWVDYQYELAKAKLRGEVKPESWERKEGVINWKNQLENEINSRQRFKSEAQQSFSESDNKSNSSTKTPIIITAIIGSVVLLGLITYKVKKSKLKR